MKDGVWDSVSEDAKKLIESCLQVDSNKRASIDDIIMSEFMLL